MKKIIRLVFVLSLMSLLSGCAYYSKMAVPGEPGQNDKYVVLKHVKESKTGLRFLTLPIDIPSGLFLMKEAIKYSDADGIINVEITFSEFNLGILSFPNVEVEGDLVKFSGPSSNSSTLQKAPSSAIMDSLKVPNVQIDPVIFSNWKKKIMGEIIKSDYYSIWKSFQKRYALKISKEEWVQSLPESEYVRYLNSKKTIYKWLEDRLTE